MKTQKFFLLSFLVLFLGFCLSSCQTENLQPQETALIQYAKGGVNSPPSAVTIEIIADQIAVGNCYHPVINGQASAQWNRDITFSLNNNTAAFFGLLEYEFMNSSGGTLFSLFSSSDAPTFSIDVTSSAPTSVIIKDPNGQTASEVYETGLFVCPSGL